MKDYPLMFQLASCIIVGGFVGIAIITVEEAIKSFIRKRKKKKQE